MDQPLRRRIASAETAGLLFQSWAFCTFYCAIAFGAFYVFAVQDRSLFGGLVSGFFAVWGVVYLWITLQKTLEYLKFGSLELRLRDAPALGVDLEGELRAPDLGLRPVQISLMAIEEVFGTDSKGRTTRSEKLAWQKIQRTNARGGRVGVRIAVPDEPEIRRDIRYLWRLRIQVDLPGIDLDRMFPLEVVSRPRTAPAPDPAGQAPETVRHAQAGDALVRAIETPATIPFARPQPAEAEEKLPPPASAPVLIAANLLLFAGVLLWDWRVADLVMLYWVENLVIGALHVLRILFARPDRLIREGPEITGGELLASKAALAGFFLVHYGGFCVAHGMLLAALFPFAGGAGATLEIGPILGNMLREPGSLGAIAVLVASHGYSFVRNYIGREEYRRVDVGRMMTRPYGRIFVVHIFIIGGGLLLQALHAPLAALLLFVALKAGIDYLMHRRERALLSPETNRA